MKNRPKHLFEFLLLRGLFVLMNLLPLRAALCAGWLIGRFMFSILRYRRAAALKRLEEVFGDRYDARERKQIAWISFRNLCFNAVEAARFHRLKPEGVRDMPLYEQLEQVRALHQEHGPLVFATAHIGNWDLGGVIGKLAGLPIFSIAKRQKNPLTDDLLNQTRNATGMEVVLNDSRVLQNVIRKLKAGEILAILPDVRVKESDLVVDFLGGRSSIGAGTAIFAQMAKCPIVPVVMVRQGWTQHQSKVLEPIFPDPSADKTADRARIMQELMSVLEKEIEARPEQYFWFNKRWVLDPVK
jgi:KDO2-lipid IV(A) lauroyltransferase